MTKASDFLPHLPNEGPPMPRFTPGWPHPGSQLHYSAEITRLAEDKRREWSSKYPNRPGLIDKAIAWADGWTDGLLRSELYSSLSPPAMAEMHVNVYKLALSKAENWIRAFIDNEI